jgi:hypothetical protein
MQAHPGHHQQGEKPHRAGAPKTMFSAAKNPPTPGIGLLIFLKLEILNMILAKMKSSTIKRRGCEPFPSPNAARAKYSPRADRTVCLLIYLCTGTPGLLRRELFKGMCSTVSAGNRSSPNGRQPPHRPNGYRSCRDWHTAAGPVYRSSGCRPGRKCTAAPIRAACRSRQFPRF